MLSAEQLRAARALLRWEQKTLAKAAGISIETIKRLEGLNGPLSAHSMTLDAIQKAFEAAGIVFIEQNGGGPGVRLRNRQD
jgi:transcriptional regulator with XRE-family HTH domain